MSTASIIPMGGGGFYNEGYDSPLDRWLLSLVDKDQPKVCFVPTASGDSTNYIVQFYRAFNRHAADPSHLSLFSRDIDDIHAFLNKQDIIYIGGGNTANMLDIWRLHGVDNAIESANENGAILTGPSAGGICWFESGVTDSFGTQLAPLQDCLGFLEGSFCPHFDGEIDREPKYREMLSSEKLPGGIAADDGVALQFKHGTLHRAVTERPDTSAYRLNKDGNTILKDPVTTELLDI